MGHEHIWLHVLLSFGGWVAYVLWMLLDNIKQYDTDDNGISMDEFTVFLKKNNISLMFCFVVAFLMVFVAPSVWELVSDKPFNEAVYAGVGVVITIIQYKSDQHKKRRRDEGL